MATLFTEDNGYLKFESRELTDEMIECLRDSTRREIISLLSEKPSYPAEIARDLGISKQKAYYHIKKLVKADLIEKEREENVSGGTATIYKSSADAVHLEFTEGEKASLSTMPESIKNFLSPLTEEKGAIVVGSPDEHGPDRVRARDGHMAGEIGLKLGQYCSPDNISVVEDVELVRDESFDRNMMLLGGVLTNTVTKRFNEYFPVKFSGESFPYREIETQESTYSEENIGVITKSEHPDNPEKSVFMVAGVRNKGTKAAVYAFKNLETIIEDYREGEFYAVVRGLDLNGDGEVDSFETVERST
ncbi:MAG: DNA-binding transcriptional ArsR family regulator [Candidatus Nanohaloarchaea archaeon]|jgi:DNA-binding transcriptional ArsR family regulator